MNTYKKVRIEKLNFTQSNLKFNNYIYYRYISIIIMDALRKQLLIPRASNFGGN